MTLLTILRYPFGDAAAIRAVSESRFALGVGAVLVLTAAIARRYDQAFIVQEPWWPLGSMALSLIASWVMLVCIYPMLWRTAPGNPTGFWAEYRTFLALFWWTAPVAWLYALPAERLFTSRTAAVVNVSLLAIVSAWRVALLVRVLCVLTGGRARTILPRVLFPASGLMALASLATSLSILGIMGGMLHSPEEGLLVAVSTFTLRGSLVCFVVSGAWIALVPPDGTESLTRPKRPGVFPTVTLAGLLAVFLILAIVPQIELWRNYRVETLMKGGRYRDALDYLGSLDPGQLSPTRPVYPNPFEDEVFIHLGSVFGALSDRDPDWVRAVYLDHLTIRLGHELRFSPPGEITTFLERLRQFPEGPRWVDDNRDNLTGVILYQLRSTMDDVDLRRLVASATNLGIDVPTER